MPDWLFFSTETDWAGNPLFCIRWTCGDPRLLFILSPIVAGVIVYCWIKAQNLWGMIRGKRY